jgi:NAD(P)-dependent dehydrogenase (short-subunit alcohol dehydrogenase family)
MLFVVMYNKNTNMKKYAFITGGNGGIGSSAVSFLKQHDYHCVLPLRSSEKAQPFVGDDSVTTFVSALNEAKSLIIELQKFKEQGIVFDVIFLAAGRFAWDKDFESEAVAVEILHAANFVTKDVVIAAFKSVYGTSLVQATLVIISSHAAHFGPEHPFRIGEEGYVKSMMEVSAMAQDLQAQDIFRKVILEEPGRVGTDSAKASFTEETIGENPDWQREKTPEDYVREIFTQIEL